MYVLSAQQHTGCRTNHLSVESFEFHPNYACNGFECDMFGVWGTVSYFIFGSVRSFFVCQWVFDS